MVDSNYFLNTVNKSVSENMRFLRDYKANPEKYADQSSSTGTGASTGTGTATDPISPMMQMMMLMMMMQMMSNMTGTNLPQLDYSTLFSNLLGGTTQNPTTTPPVTQNPAVQYLEDRFTTLAATVPTTTDPATGESPATQTPWTEDDTAQFKAQLTNGTITQTQMGQALMYELDKTDPKNLPAVGQLISSLMESGDLNIVPFLQNDYLTQISADSQDMLFRAVELSGLLLSSGQSNSRFVAFLLESLSKENPNKADQPKTQAFIQKFMQDFYNVHGKTPTAPVGTVLAQVLTLTGIKAGTDGKLVFS